MTTPRLIEQLNDFGIAISKRQVHRLLNERADGFLAEDAGVLRAGLETARWITVDDTGARHKGRNGFCTRIGNDCFTWCLTTFSKSRLNFLDLLRADHGDYMVNQTAVDYMRRRKLAGPVIKRKISGGTRSDQGRDCRDAFLGSRKTCQKLGVRFWCYLGNRLLVPDTPDVPPLPQLIRQHAAP